MSCKSLSWIFERQVHGRVAREESPWDEPEARDVDGHHGPVLWARVVRDAHGVPQDDILIVAPYNAQVFNIADRLPNCRVGTIDKFQGQEAPIVIYSMATSSPEDAPRGMEFLYSINRFNVASSRARCACILIANPRLFEPDCKTPRQMELANAFCRYLELAGKG